jgi:hypothetical protein
MVACEWAETGCIFAASSPITCNPCAEAEYPLGDEPELPPDRVGAPTP